MYLRSALLDPEAPLYQPGVPIYESYANAMQSYNALGSLQQRVGNRSWANNAGGAEAGLPEINGGTREGNGIWGRVETTHASFDPKTTTTGAGYDVGTWKMRGGLDGVLHEGAEGRLISGIFADYGTVSSDVTSVHGSGRIASTGYDVGGTLTWYGDNGFYADGQAKANWYDSDLVSSTAGRSLVDGNKGFGYLGLASNYKASGRMPQARPRALISMA